MKKTTTEAQKATSMDTSYECHPYPTDITKLNKDAGPKGTGKKY